MYHKWMRVSMVPLLAAGLWITGCSDQTGPTDRLLGPDAVSFAKDKAEKPKKEKKSKKIKVKKKKGDDTAEYTLVKGKLPVDEKGKAEKKDIGPAGGTLKLAGHTLVVPAGAVDQKTRFTMRVYRKVVDEGDPTTNADDEVAVGVELKATAYDCDGDGVPERAKGGNSCAEFNIGRKGFNVPVELSLTYGWATNVSDPSTLVIVWMKGNGIADEYSTTVDLSDMRATSYLDHFSDYLLAMP